MRRTYQVAAALLLIVGLAAAVLLPLLASRQKALAFSDVVEKLREAKSLSYTMIMQPAQGPEQRVKVTMRDPGQLRLEMSGGHVPGGLVTTMDFKSGVGLTVVPAEKTAAVMDLKGPLPGEMGADPARQTIDKLAKLSDKATRDLGRKRIDGQEVTGYEVEDEGLKFQVWAEADSGIPVLIEGDLLTGPAKVRMVMRDIVLDPKLEDSMFSTEPPAGYQVHRKAVDVSLPTEAELLAMFRLLADKLGRYPADLTDFPALGNALAQATAASQPATRTATQPDQGAAPFAMPDWAMTFQRGVQYLTMHTMKGAWYYDGQVKPGQAGKVLMWYEQLDVSSGKKLGLRVIGGDLSTTDGDPATLPKANMEAAKILAGALRAAGTQPATRPAPAATQPADWRPAAPVD